MPDVTVVFIEGGHASTAVGPLEIFGDAGTLWPAITGEPGEAKFTVRSASAGARAVRPDAPYTLTADHALDDVEATDIVFVPAGGLDVEELIARNTAVIEFVRRQHARGAAIAGVCAGVALLAEAGILDGRIATTHWGLAERYQRRYPRVDWRPAELVTESDGIYCGGGVYAALDLALYLVERFCGRKVAAECSKALLIDSPRECQAGFAVLPVGTSHHDDTIRRAEEWIHRHCQESFRFEALARQLGMSPRNFIRRFKTATGLAPTEYVQRLRIRAARRLLEAGDAGVTQVCYRVGYDDLAFFRRLFKRYTGLAPAEYRRRFGA